MNTITSFMKLVIRTAMIKYFALALAVFFALGLPAQAQSPNVPKIGFLGVRPDDSNGTFELLKRELGALGVYRWQKYCVRVPQRRKQTRATAGFGR